MGLVSYDVSSFQAKALELARALGVAPIKVDEYTVLFCLAMGIPLARLVFLEHEKSIGLSFCVDAHPEDVIYTYHAASKLISSLRMLPSHYVNKEGQQFVGPDAFVMKEVDFERSLYKAVHKKLEEDDAHYMDYVRYVSKEPLTVGKESHDVMTTHLVRR